VIITFLYFTIEINTYNKMSYGTYQNPTPLVAPYLSNGFRSTFTSGPKTRKLNRSQDHPKGDFVLDGIRMSVSDANRTMLKTRIEKVEHYREHNSFSTKLNNGAHRPRKKQLRKIPKANHQQVNASFYVLKDDESMIKRFLTKMREKEEQVASNIQRIVDEEFDSLERGPGRRYQKIFHGLHKRIAPEKQGIKYFNYLDPETMVKLDIANVKHRKSPTNKDAVADSISEFVPAHYEGYELPESGLPSLRTNRRQRSHRPRLSVIDEAEEKKARGIMRVYANRSCSPNNTAQNSFKEERQKIKTATNTRGGDNGFMTNSFIAPSSTEFAKSAYNSSREGGWIRPTRRRIESMDGRVQVKLEREESDQVARRTFLTKNSSKNTRAENQNQNYYSAIENEYSSEGGSYVALMKAQERIDHSCGMLRSQISRSREESNYHKKSTPEIHDRSGNSANLRILNVKHSNGALEISPTNQPPEGLEDFEQGVVEKKAINPEAAILNTESLSVNKTQPQDGNNNNIEFFDFLNVQHQDIKNLDLKKISNYLENIDLNQSPRGVKRGSTKELQQSQNEKEPLAELRGLEEKIIDDQLNFDNTSAGGRDPRKRSESLYKSKAPAKLKAPRNNVTEVVGRIDSANEDVSSSKRVSSGTSGK